MRQLLADMRFAIRMLRRRPWSTVSIAATLALGIGSTTAIYAVFNYVLFRPVPGVSGGAPVVAVRFSVPGRSVSGFGMPGAIPAMRAAGGAVGLEYLADHCCGSQIAVTAPIGALPIFVTGDFVTSQFFRALDVRPLIGRLLTDEEADSGSQSVAIVSETFWRTRLGGASGAVGQTISVNGHPFTVIGVTDRFRGWGRATRVGVTDLWLPMGAQQLVAGHTSVMSEAVGRARLGSSLALIEQQLQAEYAHGGWTADARARAFLPFVDPGLWPESRTTQPAMRLYWLLMAGAGLLLALACANAANLMLVRGQRRELDTAVRLAIGAGRWRIVRQVLLESVGLSVLAGIGGIGISFVLTLLLRDIRLLSYFPLLDGVTVDVRVLGFCIVVAMSTVLAFGTLPAFLASRTDIRAALARSGRTLASSHHVQRALMVAQVALSLVLLAGASALNRSLYNLTGADLGLDLNHVMELVLTPRDLGYDSRRAERIIADTVARLRQSGFREVTFADTPMSTGGDTIGVKTESMAEVRQIHPVVNGVSASYFDVLRIPTLAGRLFSDVEYRAPESVDPTPVVLNSSLAANLFGDQPAVGRTFQLERYQNVGPPVIATTATVIGVVGDTRSSTVRGTPLPALYHPGKGGWYGSILVRSDETEGLVMDRIRNVVHDVDPALPIAMLRPLRDELTERLSEDRVLARLSAILALVAVLLAATGVASVVSHLVAERTRDFGIRAALGASGRNILGHVLSGVVFQSALGLALGLVVYGGTSRWFETRLFQLEALDPLTIAGAMTTLLSVAVVAALVPARRAASIDPAVALRAE